MSAVKSTKKYEINNVFPVKLKIVTAQIRKTFVFLEFFVGRYTNYTAF